MIYDPLREHGVFPLDGQGTRSSPSSCRFCADANSIRDLSCPHRLKLLHRRLFIRRHMPGLSTSAFLTAMRTAIVSKLASDKSSPPTPNQGYCDTARERTWETGEIAKSRHSASEMAPSFSTGPRARVLYQPCYTKGSPFLKISMKARLDPLGSGSSAMQTTAADAECSSALTDCE